MTGSADVTVVIPTHRRNEYLVDAIASVVAQELSPAALVVSDDVGDLSTRSLVEDWAARAPFPVRYLDSSGPGAGTAGASRNAGAELATTGILAFLDDDDSWQPAFLRATTEALSTASADFAVAWTSADAEGYHIQRIGPGLSATQVVARNPGFVGSNFVMRTAAFRALGGFDPDLPVSNDKDFLVRALQASLHYAVVERVLVLNRIHGAGQLTDKSHRRAEGIQRYMTKHAVLLSDWDRRYLRAQLASVLRVAAPSLVARWRYTGELAALRLGLAMRGGER